MIMFLFVMLNIKLILYVQNVTLRPGLIEAKFPISYWSPLIHWSQYNTFNASEIFQVISLDLSKWSL